MPDLPLPKPAVNKTDPPSASSKVGNMFRSAIAGDKSAISASDPKPSTTASFNPSLELDEATPLVTPTTKTTGFIATPPPASVAALSSVSFNQPPAQSVVDDSFLPAPDRGPVRASDSLPPLPKPKTVADIKQPEEIDQSKKDKTDEKITKPSKEEEKLKPKFAKTNQSVLRFLPMIVGGVLLVFLAILILGKISGGSGTSSVKNSAPNANQDSTSQKEAAADRSAQTGSSGTTIEYWGLWESEADMEPAIKEFEQKNPGVSVQYVKQSYKDYRERLQAAIASGNGPDMFRFHASWTPMLASDLAPLPSNIYSTTQFQEIFYPVALNQLQMGGQIVGVPLMYDGLMLYYNTDIFATAQEKPPASWAELRTLANKLTLREGGEIKRAGVALGNASNVEHFSDILGLLMLQNGADLFYPDSPEGRDALLFYTNFVTKDKIWDGSLPNSTLAFARGDAAMMLGPSWRAHEVANINPELKFATVPLPQLSNTKVTWASYWAEGVNKKSTNKDAAWKLIGFLSSAEGQQKMYATQAQNRGFGEPYSRMDLAENLVNHPILGSLIQDAPAAAGWHMSAFTHDNGLNDQVIKYYETAVNSIISGESIQTVLTTLGTGVTQVLAKYGVDVPL